MITVTCEICGKTIRTYPSVIKKGHGRFCSRSCSAKRQPPPNGNRYVLQETEDFERFFGQVTFLESGCWLWTGRCCWTGYGEFHLYGHRRFVHRISYETFVGPSQATDTDHLCHNNDPECGGGYHCLHRRCVNPDHLRQVSHRRNMLAGKTIARVNAQKTHCPKGHPYDAVNTYWRRDGGRNCKECVREENRKARRWARG